jgi:hypothetical protein
MKPALLTVGYGKKPTPCRRGSGGIMELCRRAVKSLT